METIKESFVAIWWWFQATDEAALVAVLTLIGSSVVVSWVLQHWKRRYNIDLKNAGKKIILVVLAILSYSTAIADWYILNNPGGQFDQFFFGYGSAIAFVAIVLHRIHVSPMYDKITNLLRYVSDQTAVTRQAKYGKVSNPAVPASPTLSLDD